MGYWDDLLNNAKTALGTFGTDPNSLGPGGVPGLSINSVPKGAPSGADSAPSIMPHLFGGGGNKPILPYFHLPDASTWGQQASDAAAIEGGNPAVAQPVSSGQNPAPTLPQPDMVLPQFTAHAGPAPAAAPQGGGGAPPYGSPWDPQGVGYAKSWDPQGVAMAASQRMAGGPQPAAAPSRSPFTQIDAPNQDPNARNVRQMTALDLSGLFGGGQPAAAPQAQPTPNYVPAPTSRGSGAKAPRRARADANEPWVFPHSHAPPVSDINKVPLNKSWNPFQLFGTPT